MKYTFSLAGRLAEFSKVSFLVQAVSFECKKHLAILVQYELILLAVNLLSFLNLKADTIFVVAAWVKEILVSLFL